MKIMKKTVVATGTAIVGAGAILATTLTAINKTGQKKKENKLTMIRGLNSTYTHCDISVRSNKFLVSKGTFGSPTLNEQKTIKLGFLKAKDVDINRSHFAMVKMKTKGPFYKYQILDTRTMKLVNIGQCLVKDYEWQEDQDYSKLVVKLYSKKEILPFTINTACESFLVEKDKENGHLFTLTLFTHA